MARIIFSFGKKMKTSKGAAALQYSLSEDYEMDVLHSFRTFCFDSLPQEQMQFRYNNPK